MPPQQNHFVDDISSATDFPLGTTIIYKVKTVNYAGASPYSVELPVVVGQAPNAPTALNVARRLSETSVELQWTADLAIAGNVATL